MKIKFKMQLFLCLLALLTALSFPGCADNSPYKPSKDTPSDTVPPEINNLDKIDHISIAEANAIAEQTGSEPSLQEENIIGTVKKISNVIYGEMVIEDETGEIFVYGLNDENGISYDQMTEKPQVGDIVAVKGVLVMSGGKTQVGSKTSIPSLIDWTDAALNDDINEIQMSIPDLYEFCYPSYVAISTVSQTGSEGCGSGIILTSDGYICTNYHVVENVKTIKVTLHDDTRYTAKYIDGDEFNDVAILKIEATELPYAIIGSSQNSRVGDQVMAIGTPYSMEYRGTMTSGTISAIDRLQVIRNDSGTVNKVQKFIQTDTSVNPGNSGGPLFNTKGEVIGIVAMKISGSNYEGMGFAIPIESVTDIIDDVIRNGKITTSTGGAQKGAALGITGHSVETGTSYLLAGDKIFVIFDDPETGKPSVIAHAFTQTIVPIDDVEKLSDYSIEDFTIYEAKKTGIHITGTTPGFNSDDVLKINDVILKVNGIETDQMSILQEIIATSSIGDILNMEIDRYGFTITVKVILGSSESMEETE